MKTRTSINWGSWLREPRQQNCIVDEIQRLSKVVRAWAVAAILITVLVTSSGILILYFTGVKSVERFDAAARQATKVNEEIIRQTLNAINPNDFFFKLFEDSEWYAPTPVKDYVKLNILPVTGKKIHLYLKIKNNSDFPARNVYCMITFSSKEFVESGDAIFQELKELSGLNVFPVKSSDDYLDEAAAFEWASIPPKAQREASKSVDLTLRGNSGRITVKINSINRIAFEFRLQEPN